MLMNEKMRVRLLSFDIERIDAGEGACSLYDRERSNAVEGGGWVIPIATIMNQLMPVRGIFNEKMLARAHRCFHSEREDACEGGCVILSIAII